jgi:hypothetical protein
VRILAVDWSGNASRAAARRCICVAEARDSGAAFTSGLDRDEVTAFLLAEAERDPELVVGLDFAFGLPEWFARARGAGTGREVWGLVAREGESWLDAPQPPFWRERKPPVPGTEFRRTELDVSAPSIRPKSVFQLGGAGQVGTASLRGMPYLLRLAERFAIWPFDPPSLPLVVEVYPRLARAHAPANAPNEHVRDAAAAAIAMASWDGDWRNLPSDERYALEGRIWTSARSSSIQDASSPATCSTEA